MFHFKCDTCDFSRDIDYLPRVYVFDDGRRMDMLQRHIWCSRCNTITVAEAFDEGSERHESRVMLRDMHRRDLDRNDFKHDFEAELCRKWLAQYEEYYRDLAEWQAMRSRPQRCLRCCNEEIFVPEDEWAELPHPVCGGTLKCTASIFGGTYVGPEPHKYSIDGELIELGYRQGPFEGDQPTLLELWWPDDT